MRVSALEGAHKLSSTAIPAAARRVIVSSPRPIAGFAPVVLVLHSLGGLRFSVRPGPATGRCRVRSPCLNPLAAPCTLLLLPERRADLQIVHQKFRRCESSLAMRGRCDDQYHVLSGNQPAVAVDDRDAKQRPARLRLDR